MIRPTDLTYEKVLSREKRIIKLDKSAEKIFRDNKVLVTGAGGSIGSRVSHALVDLGCDSLLLTDRDESSLHTLSMQLSNKASLSDDNFRILDIKDKYSVLQSFELFNPQIVIHAAALKHLSVLERQPHEALETNVYGTLNLLETAESFNVSSFVNISTDKAANPISVLGKSKYIAELMTATYKRKLNLPFLSVRFGNVFASRGSVLETFISQIQKNQAITITDERVSRYFMHVDEAALLILKALSLQEADIYLFDMGEPVPIIKVIEKLKHLTGSEVDVVKIGLKPGEKMHEDLFGGIESYEQTSDGLLFSASHNESIAAQEDLIAASLGRNSLKILSFLT